MNLLLLYKQICTNKHLLKLALITIHLKYWLIKKSLVCIIKLQMKIKNKYGQE